MLSWRLSRMSTIAALAVLILNAPRARADEKRRDGEHLIHVFHELKKAQAELKGAKHDFGGHRDQALRCLHEAEGEIERALKHARVEIRAERREYKHADHPHLREVLSDIRHAREELRKTKLNFGDHRDKALRELRRAEEQVELCIKNIKR